MKQRTVILSIISIALIVLTFSLLFINDSTKEYIDPISKDEVRETGISKIYMTGSNLKKLNKKSRAYADIRIVDSDESTNETAMYVSLQGATSIAYPKKNYSLRYESNGSPDFYLKANYIDNTFSRNNVTADIWKDMVFSRKDSEISSCPTGGALTGYPVLLYMNNEYKGIYSLTDSKSPSVFEGDREPKAVIFCEQDVEEDAYANGIDLYSPSSVWDVIYCNPSFSKDLEGSISRVFNIVYSADDEHLIDELSDCLDMEAAIDYIIFMYFFQADDNYTKNIIWTTYDGVKWIPTAYDFDSSYGLTWDGMELLPSSYSLPGIEYDGDVYGGPCIIWRRILCNCYDEISSRYNYLRQDILKDKNILDRFNANYSAIPQSAKDEESNLWPEEPSRYVTDIDQIEDFLSIRGNLLDIYFNLPVGTHEAYTTWHDAVANVKPYRQNEVEVIPDNSDRLYDTLFRISLYGSPLLLIAVFVYLLLKCRHSNKLRKGDNYD